LVHRLPHGTYSFVRSTFGGSTTTACTYHWFCHAGSATTLHYHHYVSTCYRYWVLPHGSGFTPPGSLRSAPAPLHYLVHHCLPPATLLPGSLTPTVPGFPHHCRTTTTYLPACHHHHCGLRYLPALPACLPLHWFCCFLRTLYHCTALPAAFSHAYCTGSRRAPSACWITACYHHRGSWFTWFTVTTTTPAVLHLRHTTTGSCGSARSAFCHLLGLSPAPPATHLPPAIPACTTATPGFTPPLRFVLVRSGYHSPATTTCLVQFLYHYLLHKVLPPACCTLPACLPVPCTTTALHCHYTAPPCTCTCLPVHYCTCTPSGLPTSGSGFTCCTATACHRLQVPFTTVSTCHCVFVSYLPTPGFFGTWTTLQFTWFCHGSFRSSPTCLSACTIGFGSGFIFPGWLPPLLHLLVSTTALRTACTRHHLYTGSPASAVHAGLHLPACHRSAACLLPAVSPPPALALATTSTHHATHCCVLRTVRGHVPRFRYLHHLPTTLHTVLWFTCSPPGFGFYHCWFTLLPAIPPFFPAFTAVRHHRFCHLLLLYLVHYLLTTVSGSAAIGTFYWFTTTTHRTVHRFTYSACTTAGSTLHHRSHHWFCGSVRSACRGSGSAACLPGSACTLVLPPQFYGSGWFTGHLVHYAPTRSVLSLHWVLPFLHVFCTPLHCCTTPALGSGFLHHHGFVPHTTLLVRSCRCCRAVTTTALHTVPGSPAPHAAAATCLPATPLFHTGVPRCSYHRCSVVHVLDFTVTTTFLGATTILPIWYRCIPISLPTGYTTTVLPTTTVYHSCVPVRSPPPPAVRSVTTVHVRSPTGGLPLRSTCSTVSFPFAVLHVSTGSTITPPYLHTVLPHRSHGYTPFRCVYSLVLPTTTYYSYYRSPFGSPLPPVTTATTATRWTVPFTLPPFTVHWLVSLPTTTVTYHYTTPPRLLPRYHHSFTAFYLHRFPTVRFYHHHLRSYHYTTVGSGSFTAPPFALQVVYHVYWFLPAATVPPGFLHIHRATTVCSYLVPVRSLPFLWFTTRHTTWVTPPQHAGCSPFPTGPPVTCTCHYLLPPACLPAPHLHCTVSATYRLLGSGLFTTTTTVSLDSVLRATCLVHRFPTTLFPVPAVPATITSLPPHHCVHYVPGSLPRSYHSFRLWMVSSSPPLRFVLVPTVYRVLDFYVRSPPRLVVAWLPTMVDFCFGFRGCTPPPFVSPFDLLRSRLLHHLHVYAPPPVSYHHYRSVTFATFHHTTPHRLYVSFTVHVSLVFTTVRVAYHVPRSGSRLGRSTTTTTIPRGSQPSQP